LTLFALLCAGAVLVTAVLLRPDREPVGDPTVGQVTRVGVAQGGSIPEYLGTAAGALAAPLPEAGPGTWALVSLAGYHTPEQVAELLDGAEVSLVLARVPLPGRQTEIVRISALRLPEDALARMGEVAARKEREAADQRSRSAALTGADPDRVELRRVYDTGARVAAEEARAYRAGCACLYAAVVRGTPAALRGLAPRSGVRAVEPAPQVTRLDRTVSTPPLPEQSGTARPPADELLDGVPGTPDPSSGG
jgi:hypothetical protein